MSADHWHPASSKKTFSDCFHHKFYPLTMYAHLHYDKIWQNFYHLTILVYFKATKSHFSLFVESGFKSPLGNIETEDAQVSYKML